MSTRKLTRYLKFEHDRINEVIELVAKGLSTRRIRKMTDRWGRFVILVVDKASVVIARSELYDDRDEMESDYDTILALCGVSEARSEDDFFAGFGDDEDEGDLFFAGFDEIEAQLDAFFEA